MNVIGAKVEVDLVKRVNSDNPYSIDRTIYTRLFLFLYQLEYLSVLQWNTPGTLMGLHRIKFKSLMDDIKPGRRNSGSYFMDYLYDSGLVESLLNILK